MFFFKQKTAYEMRISDWSSDVCSSDLPRLARQPGQGPTFSREPDIHNGMNAPKTSGATPTGSKIAGQNAGSIPAHASPMIPSAPGQADLGAPPPAIRPEWAPPGRTKSAWGFPSIQLLDTQFVSTWCRANMCKER